MNNPIRYRGTVIEDVPGAPWTFAYGWPEANRLNFAVRPVIPDYASDELRFACWNYLAASVFGACHLCEAAASTLPAVKTAGPGVHSFVSDTLVRHEDWCPCSNDRIGELDRRDSPDGLGTPADWSEESTDALMAFLRTAVEVLT